MGNCQEEHFENNFFHGCLMLLKTIYVSSLRAHTMGLFNLKNIKMQHLM